MTVSIGADPEFFLYQYEYNEETDEEDGYTPCVGLIPGTKENPTQLGDVEGFFVHEDNVCVELGIPPTNNPYDFAEYIMSGQRMITTEYLEPNRLELVHQSSVNFRPEQLESKQAQTFGCEPDFNAYTNGVVRQAPKNLMEGTTRFAGGHIHLGGQFNCPPFVAALFADVFISLPNYNAKQMFYYRDQRTDWYGQPGIFRPKPYGIEYRTPTNAWCGSMENATLMGEKVIGLCNFLEQHNATRLREMVRGIDWLTLQQFLSKPPKIQTERQGKATDLSNEIMNVIQVAI